MSRRPVLVVRAEWYVFEIVPATRPRREGLRRVARVIRPLLTTAVAAGAVARALGTARARSSAVAGRRRLELEPPAAGQT